MQKLYFRFFICDPTDKSYLTWWDQDFDEANNK